MKHDDYLITINVPPKLEESVADFLLSLEMSQGFSSFPISAHNRDNQNLSLAEQVIGRKRKICFQIYVDKNTIGCLLTKLKTDFSGSGLHYWIVPIAEHGII